MKGKPTYENVTLQKLLATKIKERGLSRSELARHLGYTNVSKGLRKFDHYLLTLESPSDGFVIKLLSVLAINALEYSRSVCASLDRINRDAGRNFKPYLEVLLGLQVRPAIAWQIVHNLCRLPVPPELQEKPYRDEMEEVTALYQNHIENILHGSLRGNVIGFRYHRNHDCCLRFNDTLVLKEIAFVQSLPKRKELLGDRLAYLISRGMA